jgi:hypothetical protein|tara:strand:+ start:2089 stop:2310 length:222 start_codon:yes stop_codon:yes gene_type:complete
MITMIPAYGKDYKSRKSVQKALQGQADFRVMDVGSKWDGMVGNLRDLQMDGHTELKIRYAKERRVAIFDMEDL